MTAARFTNSELATCAEREVRQRKHVYARLVVAQKMTADKATKETAMMQQIADEYRAKADTEVADLFAQVIHMETRR